MDSITKHDWGASIRDQVLRTLGPVVIMSVAVGGWQFLSDGGVVELFGGVTASRFNEYVEAEDEAASGILPPATAPPAAVLRAYTGQVVVPNGPGTGVYEGAGDRGVFRETVQFPERFSAEPAVTIGLAEIDIDRDRDARIRIEVHEVFPHSFTYSFTTWEDSQVNRASATWMAVGLAEPDAASQESQEP